MSEQCYVCGTYTVFDTENHLSGCPNIRCEHQLIDKCPYCGLFSFLIGDSEVLFECQNKHIWSYHHQCSKSDHRCSEQPGEFIGWLSYENYEDEINIDYDNIDYFENHEQFVQQSPKDVAYEDCSVFLWKCTQCHQKYINMMCG